MKKSLNWLIGLLMAVCFIMPVPLKTLANETDQIIAVQVSENEIWYFSTPEDYQSYLKHQESKTPVIQPHGEFTTTQEISRQNLKIKFVGYHALTPSWAKASSYTVNAGLTASASIEYTYKQFTCKLTASKTFGVDTNIPADSSKFSRLGLYGDFLVKHMRTNYHDSSGIYDTYDYISTQTLNTYVLVTYQ